MAAPHAEHLFVSTTPGLEPALDAELRALGIGVRRVAGGAEVSGPPGLHQRLNLELRTASRVLLRAGTFPARDVPALQTGLARVAIRDYWNGTWPLRIGVTTHRSRLHHKDELRQLAARAWGATVATAKPVATGAAATTPDDEGAADELMVQLRIDEDMATVSVDTSGELLYRRGYRQEVSRAPLRETLAAGMLVLAGYRGDEPLWDPMCGSGTLPIEGAWMALRKAPGMERPSFAFQSFPTFDAAAFEKLKVEFKAKERATLPAPVYATDVHAGALGTARRNARRAGVQPLLKLERVDVLKPAFVPPEAHGLLIANMPYGIRVAARSELASLYRGVGALLRDRLPKWRAALLVADRDAERHLGLDVEDAFDVQNGGIRCQLLLCRSRTA